MTTQFSALTDSGARQNTDQVAVARGSTTVRMDMLELLAGLTGDQTGPAIVTLLQALTGNNQLNATALRLIADAIDTELGNTTWRTGGAAQTAAQILALLLTVDGAGSGLDADLLDGMTPAQVAALGSGGFTLRFGADAPADSLGIDGDWYIATTAGGFYQRTAGSYVLRYTTPAAAGLNQGQVDARITNRIAPRVFVSTAAFTQTGLNFVNISVTPTTTGAPVAGDVVIFRTPASIVSTTGVALGLIIDGIGGNPVYILDRSDGLPLNASDFAVDSIYTSVFDGTNFEIVGPPLSPRMALLGDDGRLSENQMSNRFRRSLPTFAAAAGVTWDPSTHTLTATVAGIPSITGGDEVIMGLPAAMPGRDATRSLVSINGEASQLLNSFTGDGMDRVPSQELTPGGILLMYRTGFGYRLLEPHILERAGEWADDVIYLLGQDVTRNGFDYKNLNETSVNQDPETNPSIWLRFPHIWQDEGVSFTDAITGTNFVGAGVTSGVVDGVLTVTIPGGGMPTPTPTDDFYFGTSADTTPLGSELTVAGVNGVGTISAYVGSMYHLISRLATEADITSVVYSDDPTMVNEIGAFTKFASTVVPTGETLAFNVWVSNQNLTNASDVALTVS